MRTHFVIPLVLMSLVLFPSWAVTFKDGKISSENVILDRCNSDYKDNCSGTEENAFGTYKGEFQKNKRHGQGEWILRDGTRHVGEFKDGVHFTGKVFYNNGQVWTGTFIDVNYGGGHLNTVGEMTINYPDGGKYVGNTLGEHRHGKGTYTAKDGRVEKGVFEFGELTNSTSSQLVDFDDWDDLSICARATIDGKWEVTEQLLSAVEEAKKRGLSCNVREAQASSNNLVSIYLDTTVPKSFSSNGVKDEATSHNALPATEPQFSQPAAVNTATNDDASFWSKTDQFLGMIADGISKKDAITGLRTLDSPFHSEDHYRRQGQQTLDLIKKKARSDGVKIFSSNEPEYQRVKRIVDRLVDASHYRNHKDKVRYAVIDYEDFQAYAFGGGYFVVFTGLMKQTNDDELAYVIAHELAHNTAGHIEESFFLKVKDVFGDKPTSAYSTSYTNIKEQEADRIAIVYAALAGYDPRASATIWEKQYQGFEQYAFYRSHPANPQRVQANRYASNLMMKHFTRGVVSPNVDKVLKCNELFVIHPCLK